MLTVIQKYLQNEASPKEIEQIQAWVLEHPENEKIFKEQVYIYNYTTPDKDLRFNVNDDWLDLKNKILVKEKRRFPFKKYTKLFKYAAVLITLLGSTLVWKIIQKNGIQKENHTIVASPETSPIIEQVQLTLSDGSIQVLDKETGSHIKDINGIVISKKEENSLSYNVETVPKNTEVVYNHINIPKGEIFKLILSDGTKVWLNAKSKLTFPQQFLEHQKTRTVTLTGEAYFEVAKNAKQPFIVETNNVNVKVLGTKFNISSYDTDLKINTTLLEGSVQLNSKSNTQKTILTPGYQASFDQHTNKMIQYKVDPNDFIAWTENKFIFSNKTFKELTHKIERSYNLTIINTYEELNDLRFTGEFDLENASEIFETFKISAPFYYEINNNIVTIKKKKG